MTQITVGNNSRPNMAIIRRDWTCSPQQMLKAIMTNTVVDFLVEQMNLIRERKINTNKMAASWRKYYNKPITRSEFFRFYGITILLENRFSNENRDIRSIRKCLEEERKADLPIGIHRYSVLQECLSLTATQQLQLYQRLRLRLREIWIYDGVMTIDECIYAYQVSPIKKDRAKDSADQIPVVFIPRKPHRNGLLNYKGVVCSGKTGLPFMLDFEPHVQFPQITPREALRSIVNRWAHVPVSIVADCGFGGIELLNELRQLGIRATFSLSNNESSYIWEIMKRGIRRGRWNACTSSAGLVLSIFQGPDVIGEEKGPFQLLGTTHFTTHFVDPYTQRSNIPTSIVFSENFLRGKKIPELKEICRQYHIPSSGNKPTIIGRVMKIVNNYSEHKDNIERLVSHFEQTSFDSPAVQHQFYRKNFNGVDRHDRYFYLCNFKCRAKSWTTKFVLSVFTDIMTNAWVIYNDFRRIDLPTFRRLVADALCDEEQ